MPSREELLRLAEPLEAFMEKVGKVMMLPDDALSTAGKAAATSILTALNLRHVEAAAASLRAMAAQQGEG